MLKQVLTGLAALAIAPTVVALPAVSEEIQVIANAHAAPAADAPTEEAMAEEAATNDIVSVAVAAGTFETLVAALTAAELVETLQGEGPFTVFAPTDEAFAALPEGTLDTLLLPENKDLLVEILTYHVVPGTVTSANLVSGDVETASGATATVVVDGETVMVNEASVVAADIEASNGVVHVIDTVLLPPQQ